MIKTTGSLRRIIAITLPPVILCLVAMRQLYLTNDHRLVSWKGGGFGMFASLDDWSTRRILFECRTEADLYKQTFPQKGAPSQLNESQLAWARLTSFFSEDKIYEPEFGIDNLRQSAECITCPDLTLRRLKFDLDTKVLSWSTLFKTSIGKECQ